MNSLLIVVVVFSLISLAALIMSIINSTKGSTKGDTGNAGPAGPAGPAGGNLSSDRTVLEVANGATTAIAADKIAGAFLILLEGPDIITVNGPTSADLDTALGDIVGSSFTITFIQQYRTQVDSIFNIAGMALTLEKEPPQLVLLCQRQSNGWVTFVGS